MTNILELFIKEKMIGKTVKIFMEGFNFPFRCKILDIIYDNNHAVALYIKASDGESLAFLNLIELIHLEEEEDE